jgi:hypothetical protein
MARGFFGHAGRPGQRGGSVAAGEVQEQLKDPARKARDRGAQTYTSSMTSPNMGERHFMDISHKDPRVEAQLVSEVQGHMDTISAQHRAAGSKTYVSSSKSPNMGTRVFMDIAEQGGRSMSTMDKAAKTNTLSKNEPGYDKWLASRQPKERASGKTVKVPRPFENDKHGVYMTRTPTRKIWSK